MYHRTIYCYVLMDMLYCPHKTGRFFNRWSFLRVERSSPPENRRIKQIYLPVSKNMCTMVHLSTCTNGRITCRWNAGKVRGFDSWRRGIGRLVALSEPREVES